MKTSFTALSAVLLGASMVVAAADPAPTALAKRQQFPDGIDISAMLANPSSYLAGVSSALANNQNAKQYAAMWASVTNDDTFQKSISHALVDQFGSKTAHIALAQYTNAVAASSSAVAAAASGTGSGSSANNNADASSSSQQVSNNIVTSGASGLFAPAGMVGFAIAAVPAVLLAVL